MARSRNIKPGFFTNDELGGLPALTRLLFAGLWTICDREGRCEDRPKKIKAEVLPYDDCDADAMLEDLQRAGFIERYTAGTARIIQVLTWGKHQNPHVKEAASTLPAPDKHQTSTVQAPDNAQPLPERAGLIPSTLIPSTLIPDSLVMPRRRGSRRCPETFEVTPELRQWAHENAPRADVDRETMKFRNHEFAKARSDWHATWKNWLMGADDRVKKGTAQAESFRERDQHAIAARVAQFAPGIAARPIRQQQHFDIDAEEITNVAPRIVG